ncbi:MAG: bacillopeptidase [Myxococcaceae bacterium]|jgi:hypothetical protein|nr:bacillopeptidase [Myxococcaceae bacterium]
MNTLRALVLAPLMALAACAAPADEATDASEDDLHSLQSNNVLGDIAVDGHWHEADQRGHDGPSGFYALRFTAKAGDQITANVMVTNASDPVAAIFDSKQKVVTQNDNAHAGTLDSKIELTIKKTGTYYIGFRNKEKWGAQYEVSLTSGVIAPAAPTSAPPPADFRDGWPASASKVYNVDVRSPDSKGEINGSGCPAVPPAGTSLGANNFRCQINLGSNQISCLAASEIIGGSATIAADGSFDIEGDPWGARGEYTKVRGHLSSGGQVSVESAAFMHCDHNSSDQPVFNSVTFGAGSGVAVPR